MSIAPPFKGTSNTMSQTQVATANANYDGTGTVATLLTGADNGTIVEKIMYKAAGTTTAGMVRIFLDDLSNVRHLAEISVAAATVSATVQASTGTWTPPGELIVPKGWILKVSTAVAETIDVFAFGGDV